MIKMYGLVYKKTGELLGFEAEIAGEGDATVSVELVESSDSVWLVPEKETAIRARVAKPWNYSEYSMPGHVFDPEDLEVAEVELLYSLEESS